MIVSHLIKIWVLLDYYKCVFKSTSQTDFLKVVAYKTQLSEIGFSDIHLLVMYVGFRIDGPILAHLTAATGVC